MWKNNDEFCTTAFSFVFASLCFALPCFALLCLTLACFGLLCLALTCFALPCFVLFSVSQRIKEKKSQSQESDCYHSLQHNVSQTGRPKWCTGLLAFRRPSCLTCGVTFFCCDASIEGLLSDRMGTFMYSSGTAENEERTSLPSILPPPPFFPFAPRRQGPCLVCVDPPIEDGERQPLLPLTAADIKVLRSDMPFKALPENGLVCRACAKKGVG